MRLQGRCSKRGQLVGPTATDGLETFNEAEFYESIESRVQSSWGKIDSRELFNVFCQRVSVLRAFRQTGEDEGCRTRITTERREFT
jgi:hypothetical protein